MGFKPRSPCYLRSCVATQAFVPLNKRKAFKLATCADYKVCASRGLFCARNAVLRALAQASNES